MYFFTFHSGYILIECFRVCGCGITLYIPFWLYSNGNFIFIKCSFANLYIPFWLYSNWSQKRNIIKKHTNFTFHSGYILMVSGTRQIQVTASLYIPFWLYSNWAVRRCKEGWRELYIPFWLYSNYNGRKPWSRWCILYIPFWLYSNAGLLAGTGFGVSFTFHSGYILIISVPGFLVIF